MMTGDDFIGIGEALISGSRIVPGEKGLVVAPRLIMQDTGCIHHPGRHIRPGEKSLKTTDRQSI